MSDTGLNVDLAQSMMISPQSIVVANNNHHGSIVSGAGRSYNTRRIPQTIAGGNPSNNGGGNTFLTEVATNDHYDTRIVYPNVAETPHPAITKGKSYHAPVQELGSQLYALHKKQQQILRKINDQRQTIHQPIVVHGYKDSQFNNGIRKLPPPQKKDAYYPLKKLNKRKQIEELAAELSKKDNFGHSFSKHSVDDDTLSVRSRRSTKSRSLPPISTRSENSDAISQAFSDLNPDRDYHDDKISQFSSTSKNSRKSRKGESEVSFSIGSDAESDRIRQLEESLKQEESSRQTFLKVLDDIQKKQEYLLSKLSPDDRKQFENLYGASSLVASLMPSKDTDSVSHLSTKDVDALSTREHLPKLDNQPPSQKGPKSVFSAAPSQHSQVSRHSYHSQQSQQSNISKSASQYSYQSRNSNTSHTSGKTTTSQISTIKKMIKEMFHTIVSTESIVTLDQSTQLAKLLEKYPDVLNEEDKQRFYAKHNDPRFNGASYRSLNTKDHFGRVVFY
ncbi:predicted protein [Naegleria gruberi]|uniref:Predicted protein n=1 Tax=Naegleria gruberi TaxID=5762 RepID=D2VX40_NAEGR|nr:uncharacterized protein NAEGRDRAFT_81553 [Naegleria gruberi]EFC38556.1 predicted protein [Naegleria gruberi]|eukprot:XP_002671300.1 predicted protein [Naegleria gruberi strain NEG-M]